MNSQAFLLFTLWCGAIGLTGCANTSALDVTRALFGYVEPPKAESVMTSLKREYNRCLKIDRDRNCVQIAYDIVRRDQGLDPKPIPKGYIVITQEAIENSDTVKEDSEQEN